MLNWNCCLYSFYFLDCDLRITFRVLSHFVLFPFFFIFSAKNLILAGVKSVTLHDERVVELWDLSSNFVFSEDDVGKNRADASVQKLQDLNNAVIVSSLTTSLTKEHLSGFQVGRQLFSLVIGSIWSGSFVCILDRYIDNFRVN